MSTLKTNNVQVGQSITATNNFTLYQPSVPDGTVRLGIGNTGATTADVLVANSSSQVMVGTATPSTGAALTVNGSIKGTITSGTAVASTSGTSIDFTSIPSWVKRITVMLSGVSTSGTSNPLIQIGSGSVSTSGYVSASGRTNSANNAAMATSTAGFIILNAGASDAIRGAVTLFLLTGNTWVANGVLTDSGTLISMTVGGTSPALSGALDRVRITTVNGTDTFDAGTVNILYEG